MKPSPLRAKSYDMAVAIVLLVKDVQAKHREYTLTKQLVRCGTNPGAMTREAKQAESKADFIHKLSIAAKEADEAEFWLEVFEDTGYLEGVDATRAIQLTKEVIRLLTAILKTSKANLAAEKSRRKGR